MPSKPWSKQAELDRQRMPTPEELLTIVRGIPHLRVQALVVITYLTGGRITEIVKEKYLRKVIYKKDEDGKLIKEGNLYAIESVEKKHIDYPGIIKSDIKYTTLDGRKALIIDMQNRKNKTQKRKQIPLIFDIEFEFMSILEEYLRTLRDKEPLFNFGSRRAYDLLVRHTGFNCHWFRHIRLSHLASIYKMSEFRLERMAGWSDARPAKKYVKMMLEDIWR